jgi:N-glycosylase/DNA lyase
VEPAQVAQFGRAHFGPLAGFAQQYPFAYERAAARGAVTLPAG